MLTKNNRAHKWREGAKEKLRETRGLSLTELLVTMIILLLTTGLATDGIPAVIRTYRRAVDVANAETYLNTVTIALRNRLSLASWDKEKNEYIDPKLGRYTISNSDNGIQIQEGVDIEEDENHKRPAPKPLVPSEEFVSSYGEISGEGDYFQVTELTVTKKGEPLAKLDAPYYIRKLNPTTDDS